MIAFSPLAMGVLTGKYAGGAMPDGARLTLFQRYRSRYCGNEMLGCADRYMRLARESGLDPAVMAMAWLRDRPGLTAVLSSCTQEQQVDALLEAGTATLPNDLCRQLEMVN
jgi:aryl-alcohol dehydrogenase-like predicted oxidoreductase